MRTDQAKLNRNSFRGYYETKSINVARRHVYKLKCKIIKAFLECRSNVPISINQQNELDFGFVAKEFMNNTSKKIKADPNKCTP